MKVLTVLDKVLYDYGPILFIFEIHTFILLSSTTPLSSKKQ